MTESRSGVTMGTHIDKEGVPMTNAESVKKHHAKLDEFKIRPYAEEGQTIREYAAAHGMSVQGLFLEAVREYIKRHEEDAKA